MGGMAKKIPPNNLVNHLTDANIPNLAKQL